MDGMKAICISAGSQGRRWVGWAREAGVDVAGLVDLDRAKLDEAGEELGIPPEARFESIAQAAQTTAAPFAIATTQSPAHASVATEVLNAGLHLQIEKPLAESMDDARRVVALAEAKGLVLAVNQQYRFESPVRTLRDAIRGGAIGEPALVALQFFRKRPTQGLALPLMLNQLIHQLDAARFLLGRDPVSVMAHSWNPPWNACDGPTMLEATYLMEGDVMFHASGAYCARGRVTPYSGVWRIEGSEGQLTYSGDRDDARIRRTSSPAGEELTVPIPAADAGSTALLCRDVMAAIREGRDPETVGRDNLKSLAMVFAAQRSSDTGREVEISEV